MGRESPEGPRPSGRGDQEGEDKDAGEQRGVGPPRFARWTQIRAAPCCDRRAAHLPMIQDEPRGRRPRVGGLPTIRHANVLFSLRGTKTQHYTERTRENGNREAINQMVYDEIYSLPRPCPLYSTAERRASADAEVANRQDAHTHRETRYKTRRQDAHTHTHTHTRHTEDRQQSRLIQRQGHQSNQGRVPFIHEHADINRQKKGGITLDSPNAWIDTKWIRSDKPVVQ